MSCFGEPLGLNQFNKQLKYHGEKAGVSGKKMTAYLDEEYDPKRM